MTPSGRTMTSITRKTSCSERFSSQQNGGQRRADHALHQSASRIPFRSRVTWHWQGNLDHGQHRGMLHIRDNDESRTDCLKQKAAA